jgi:hypothetical protein
VPVVAPITEPAVGYGAIGSVVFVDRNEPAPGQPFARPNIAAVGGLATENGTQGAFGAHLGNWREGRVRTLAALAKVDLNLDFFGLGAGQGPPANGVGYAIEATGGVLGASGQLGRSSFWAGVRYVRAATTVSLQRSLPGLPGVSADDFDLTLAALTPSVTYDTRDNFFTPTRGWYVDLSLPLYREALGSDRDFETSTLTVLYFHPVASSLFLSARGTAQWSSSDTPFYLRPFVQLRGVQALRYQGDQAASGEAELRWQFHPRFSAVAFAGAGQARAQIASRDREESVTSGGVGLRYLVARQHGLHMGLDVAFGPDSPVLYVVFGSPWLRP